LTPTQYCEVNKRDNRNTRAIQREKNQIIHKKDKIKASMARKKEVEVPSPHFVMEPKVEPESIPEELLDS
jgi:hypothetical protein